MNFLIAVGLSNFEKAKKLQLLDYSFDDFGVAHSDLFFKRHKGNLVVASHKPETGQYGEKDMILWDGAIVDSEIAFSTIMPAPNSSSRMKKYISTINENREPKGYSGVFGCAQISSDGTILMASDQLSQYAFFYLSDSGGHLFSNSLHLIEKTSKLLGINVTRDFASNAYEAAFGAGGWCRTGLSRVKKMPPNHFMSYRQGKMKFIPFPSAVFAQRPNSEKYQDNIHIASASLKASASALSNAFPKKGLMLDLSGGKDTRLLLAAQLATKERGFHVFVGGQPEGTDHQAASRLVHHYNLDSVYFPSNVGADENLSPIEVVRRSAYRNMGTSNLYQSDVGCVTLSDVAKIRGGSSEGRTKSFFVYPATKKSKKIMRYARFLKNGQVKANKWLRVVTELAPQRQKQQKLLTAMVLARGRRGHYLFRQEFLQDAYRSVFSNIKWLEEQGVAPENLADTYYIFDRGWRHCGFPVQVMNGIRPTFEPLNNISLLKAQFYLGTEDRQKARVAFDLFEKFDVPNLIEIPFENSNWPGDFLSQESLQKRSALSHISTDPPRTRAITGRSGRADSMHTLGRVRYIREVQDYMLDLASGISTNHECWDYLRREVLLKSISSGVFATDLFASLGVRLLHGFIWLSHEESRYPFSSPEN